MKYKVCKTDEAWRRELGEEGYRICRRKGTEPAFSGEYYASDEKGIYHCRCCGAELFKSDAKYDSGTGWPSFHAPMSSDIIEEQEDHSLAQRRIEILCRQCGAHLGHVFEDGPPPTGLRYCVNSASLRFEPVD